MPYRFHPDDLPRERLAALRCCERAFRRRRGEGGDPRRPDRARARLPLLVRQRLPKATIVTFWHIPWPNSETFSICPWREQIIDGLLGSTTWASTPSSIATISSRRPTASWKAASIGSAPLSP